LFYVGPTKPTIDDIWRMVWQEDSKTIIMLTNPTETGKVCLDTYIAVIVNILM